MSLKYEPASEPLHISVCVTPPPTDALSYCNFISDQNRLCGDFKASLAEDKG